MTDARDASVVLPVLVWGPPDAASRVLLVHGLSANANAWWRVADELAQRGCRVVAPDLRGHGAAPRTASYTLAAHAADLHRLGSGWTVAVGHSLGGAIVATAAQRPGFAGGLVLLDPVLEIDDDELPAVLADQLSELDPNADPAAIHAVHPAWHAEDAFQKAMAARATSAFVVERCLLDNAPWSHLDLLRTDYPTLVLGADTAVGTMFPPDRADALRDAQSVHYRRCPGVGHGIHREAPDLVVAAVTDLLSREPG